MENLNPNFHNTCGNCKNSLMWANRETIECRLVLPPWVPKPPPIQRTVEARDWCSFWTGTAETTR